MQNALLLTEGEGRFLRNPENWRPSIAALLNGAGGSSITLLFTAGCDDAVTVKKVYVGQRLHKKKRWC